MQWFLGAETPHTVSDASSIAASLKKPVGVVETAATHAAEWFTARGPSVAGAIILLLITNLKLTAYILLILPLVVAPIILLGRRVRSLARDSQDRVADISAHAEETLSAIRTAPVCLKTGTEMA